MPDDRLRQIFEQIAELPVDIPPADRVLARGRQRHDRTRLRMSTIAATILLAAGLGGPQVAGSLAANPRLIRHAPPEAGSPQASPPASTPLTARLARHRAARPSLAQPSPVIRHIATRRLVT